MDKFPKKYIDKFPKKNIYWEIKVAPHWLMSKGRQVGKVVGSVIFLGRR